MPSVPGSNCGAVPPPPPSMLPPALLSVGAPPCGCLCPASCRGRRSPLPLPCFQRSALSAAACGGHVLHHRCHVWGRSSGDPAACPRPLAVTLATMRSLTLRSPDSLKTFTQRSVFVDQRQRQVDVCFSDVMYGIRVGTRSAPRQLFHLASGADSCVVPEQKALAAQYHTPRHEVSLSHSTQVRTSSAAAESWRAPCTSRRRQRPRTSSPAPHSRCHSVGSDGPESAARCRRAPSRRYGSQADPRAGCCTCCCCCAVALRADRQSPSRAPASRLESDEHQHVMAGTSFTKHHGQRRAHALRSANVQQ